MGAIRSLEMDFIQAWEAIPKVDYKTTGIDNLIIM